MRMGHLFKSKLVKVREMIFVSYYTPFLFFLFCRELWLTRTSHLHLMSLKLRISCARSCQTLPPQRLHIHPVRKKNWLIDVFSWLHVFLYIKEKAGNRHCATLWWLFFFRPNNILWREPQPLKKKKQYKQLDLMHHISAVYPIYLGLLLLDQTWNLAWDIFYSQLPFWSNLPPYSRLDSYMF